MNNEHIARAARDWIVWAGLGSVLLGSFLVDMALEIYYHTLAYRLPVVGFRITAGTLFLIVAWYAFFTFYWFFYLTTDNGHPDPDEL